MSDLSSTPVPFTSTVAPSLASKIVLAIFVSTVVVAAGVAGVLIGRNNPQSSTNDGNSIVEEESLSNETSEPAEGEDIGCGLTQYSNDSYPDFTFEYNSCEWEVSEQFESAVVLEDSDYFRVILTNLVNEDVLTFNIDNVAYFTGYGFFCHDTQYELINTQIARATVTDETVFDDGQAYLQYVPVDDPLSASDFPNLNDGRDPNCSTNEGNFLTQTVISIPQTILDQIAEFDTPQDAIYKGFLKVYAPSINLDLDKIDTIVNSMTW